MKKFFIALLFTVSSLSMQTASAATLTLGNYIGGSVVTATGSTVSGTATGAPTAFFGMPFSSWSLNVSDTGLVNFNLSGTTSFISMIGGNGSILDFNTTSFSTVLAAGNYLFAVLPSSANQAYNLSINSVVPVPAAVWLFGSAFLGMLGLVRRKSQTGFAA